MAGFLMGYVFGGRPFYDEIWHNCVNIIFTTGRPVISDFSYTALDNRHDEWRWEAVAGALAYT